MSGEAGVVGSESCREDPAGTEGEARGSCTDWTGDGAIFSSDGGVRQQRRWSSQMH